MYRKTVEEITSLYNTNIEHGLSEEQVRENSKIYGYNKIENKKRKNIILIFLGNFVDWLVIILLVAAIVSVIVDPSDYIESTIILGVLIINALIDTIEQVKTTKALNALKKLSKSDVLVLRANKQIKIDSEQLVPGDIILLRKGDIIPADIRIIKSNNLEVDESSITGESLGVQKEEIVLRQTRELHSQSNMLFSSSSILKGNCSGIVVATGANSTLGEIAKNLKEETKLSPLQIKLDKLAKVIGISCIIICLIVFGLEVANGTSYLDALKSSIALSVAAIPEGLACIVTLILTLGVNRMAKRNVIIKKLDKVETLGSVNIICTDKTGTLTENKMRLEGVYTDFYSKVDNLPQEALRCLKWANLAINQEDIDQTDTSILNEANKYDKINHELIKLVPFDSKSKMLKVIVKINGKKYLIVKGAFDYIIKNSMYKDRWNKAHEQLASKGLRVICVGFKEVYDTNMDLNDIKILGLLAIKDNLRKNIQESIKEAKKAKIRTIMITGDHKLTATSIAKEAGILDDYEVITSEELNKLTDEEFEKNITRYSVYARMTPFDKVRIVKAWQKKDLVVAMTGDGVNDSIALHQADCGVGLGSGCDVSKEASDLIIVDDNYSSIVKGVKEGRRVYDNICKCVKYLLASNIGEVLAIFIVAVVALTTQIKYGVALAPIHLLFVNLITDSIPAFALGLEQADLDIMSKPPKSMNDSIINKRTAIDICLNGLVIGLATVWAFFIGFEFSYLCAMTMAFLTLSLSQLFHAYNSKSPNTIFSKQTFNNKVLNFAFIFGVIISLIIIYSPINSIFKLTPLNPNQIVTVILLSGLCIISSEIFKTFKSKNNINLFYF